MNENETADAIYRAADGIYRAADGFVQNARDELAVRLRTWKVDLSTAEVHEVLGALLARQVTLATELALCPQLWNGHIAPLILRAMADVYITIAWILKDPLARGRRFVEYGLGRLKLELEHRKAQSEELDDGQRHFVEVCENWINQQRQTFLLSVNLGSWSGLSTRQMAEEAGHIDFYNYVYTPFSACAHSMWHHVARYNLMECGNPLHQYHRIPTCPELAVDIDYLYLAAKYLQKTLTTFDEALGIQLPARKSAFEYLCERFSQIAEEEGAQE